MEELIDAIREELWSHHYNVAKINCLPYCKTENGKKELISHIKKFVKEAFNEVVNNIDSDLEQLEQYAKEVQND